MLTTLLILLVLSLLASLLSLLLYKKDKTAAIRGTWRTRERTLHIIALCGGWPGALLAQRVFRHKTKDQPFRILFWCTVALHLIFAVSILYLAFLATRPTP